VKNNATGLLAARRIFGRSLRALNRGIFSCKMFSIQKKNQTHYAARFCGTHIKEIYLNVFREFFSPVEKITLLLESK
jgi:hypothetical protein